jgi:hypothetical protein
MTVLRRTLLSEDREIGSVHRQNIMEMLEIPLMYAPRTQSPRVVATPGRCLLGSFIRRLTLMIIMRASGIDVKGLFEAGSPDLLTEYGLRSGGASNITHANK